MKTAYELAMERLNKTAPTVKLTAGKKRRLAELDSQYAAKIAGREIALQDEIGKAAADDVEKVETLQQQLVNERKKLQAELEEKKEQVRRTSAK
jgi:septin family protein